MEVVQYLRLPYNRDNKLYYDDSGFLCTRELWKIGNGEPLIKFNNKGQLEWVYTPKEGQTFYHFNRDKDHYYFAGVTTNQGLIGRNNSLLVTLSKDGSVEDTQFVKGGSPYEWVFANEKGVYVSSDDNLKGNKVFYRVKKKETASPSCVWENWAGHRIGGCGIYDNYVGWIIRPVINGSPESDGVWMVYPFEGGKAKVIKNGKVMFVDESGKIL